MPELPPQGICPVWIASYPRSGNTFLRIVFQNIFGLPSYSLYRIEGDSHPDPSADALEQSPYLPTDWRKRISDDPSATTALIKTHDLPEDGRRAIYVIRDGRPVIHSYYHYIQKYAFEKVSLTDTIAGACQFGSWSEHYESWQPRTRPNTLFLRYEDLVARPMEVIPQIADFLKTPPVGGTLPTFDELKQKQPDFFRRGQNTDFATEWAPGQLALFNELHGPVMKELGYRTDGSTASPAETIRDLARSGSRLYKERLEHLTQLGSTAAVNQQLLNQTREVAMSTAKLRVEIAELSQRLQQASTESADRQRKLDHLLNRKWVKIGLALRAVKPPDGNR